MIITLIFRRTCIYIHTYIPTCVTFHLHPLSLHMGNRIRMYVTLHMYICYKEPKESKDLREGKKSIWLFSVKYNYHFLYIF